MNVGIDLGTTFSLIGHVNAKSAPALFPDLHDANQFRTPSVVHVGAVGALIGQNAEELLRSDPGLDVARFAKLEMGSDDPIYEFDVAGATQSEKIALCPTAISALILRKLKQDAESFANEDIEGCVVGVPANFGSVQRRATRDAVLAAGLPMPELVDEPVAAAIYHGMEHAGRDQTLLAYDLGGGTFDATVMQAAPSGLHVLATEGSNDIGGARFDEMIMDMVAADMRRDHGTNVRSDQGSWQRLRRFAEETKIKLSRPSAREVKETLLVGGSAVDVHLTPADFERMIDPLVAETLAVSDRCLEAAGLSWDMVDFVLMAGGSTQLPCVKSALLRHSGKVGDQIVMRQPHQAVSFGAALLAARGEHVAGRPDLVHNIAAYDLGLRVRDPASGGTRIDVMIPRNAALPATQSATFYTTRSDQTRMVFELVQARGDESSTNSLGHFAFMIAEPRKNYPVELSVGYDLSGLVRVTARDPRTGKELEHLIEDQGRADAARIARVRGQIDSLQLAE